MRGIDDLTRRQIRVMGLIMQCKRTTLVVGTDSSEIDHDIHAGSLENRRRTDAGTLQNSGCGKSAYGRRSASSLALTTAQSSCRDHDKLGGVGGESFTSVSVLNTGSPGSTAWDVSSQS